MSLELILILYFASIIIACIYAQVRIPNKEKFGVVSVVLFILSLLLIQVDISGQISFVHSEVAKYRNYHPLAASIIFFSPPFVMALEISSAYILIKDYIKLPYGFFAMFITAMFYTTLAYFIYLLYMLSSYH